MNTLISIKGCVQTYQWGGLEYLPSLLQYRNDEQQPQAEYWLGVHPAAPSEAESTGGAEPLGDVLATQGWQLNFLLKVLDVRDMLSIQVHPTKEQARQGYHREEQQGIAVTAKNRNYKDTNHKPELMVALSEFWLLHGFKTETEIAKGLASRDYLAPLLDTLNNRGLETAFAFALDADNPATIKMNARLAAEFSTSSAYSEKHQIEFWIQRWLKRNPEALNGLLTLFFLNLVKMNPGEAIYQPSGLLHAYLEGQNVELMANSDNVLRAGLTPKHIDVPELLQVCCIEPSAPREYVITPEHMANQELRFSTPFEEFELSELNSARATNVRWQPETVEILLCLQGAAEVSRDEDNLQLERGQALLIAPGDEVTVRFSSEDAQLYKAKNL